MAQKNGKSDEKDKSRNGNKNKQNNMKKEVRESNLKQETKHGIYAIIAFVVAFFFILAAFKGAGPTGNFFYSLFSTLFGVGYILVPSLAILLGVSFLQSVRPNIGWSHTISSAVFLLSGLGIIDIATTTHKGGIVGTIAAYPFVKLFATGFSVLILTAALVISLLVLFDTRLSFSNFWNRIRRMFGFKVKENDKEVLEEKEVRKIDKMIEDAEMDEPKQTMKEKIAKVTGMDKKDLPAQSGDDELGMAKGFAFISGDYTPPPLSLLEKDSGKPNVGDIKGNSNIIKRTLANFGIEVEMDEITVGPSVTRYALKPAEGVKLSRIVGLQSDLALALAAHPIRIEAPIPGKSLVGIEIPNKVKSTVGLASLLSDEKFQNAPKPLMIALGRGISGKSMIANLAKMPHMLIAGTTGSGKSVTIHSIITSLLYRNGPNDLRLIMVDPKRVELTLYNKIPHLLTPVITDPKKAILALKWAANEMSRRYDLFEADSVRDIESYHKNIGTGEGAPDRMPYIVIIIDELADIMTSYPRELESAIVRLAQMSRAVGIHLILSTQRPEVSVITGLIKANVPARIALKVSSQIDSRTILDAGGAEKLLGAGDMLYSGGEGQPERLQSAFISEDEVKKVVKYLANNYKDEVPSDIALTGPISADKSIFDATLDDSDEGDELYEEAREIVISAGKASTSYLQRKLGVGYARAARIIDILEERGVVGPGSGSKPREVLEKTMAEESQGFQ
jgi:S-DNA-T family DNA segregation ATPase FtsK/SpoIIIE